MRAPKLELRKPTNIWRKLPHSITRLLRMPGCRRFDFLLLRCFAQAMRFFATLPFVMPAPKIREFLARRRRALDPAERFQSTWHRHYRELFA